MGFASLVVDSALADSSAHSSRYQQNYPALCRSPASARKHYCPGYTRWPQARSHTSRSSGESSGSVYQDGKPLLRLVVGRSFRAENSAKVGSKPTKAPHSYSCLIHQRGKFRLLGKPAVTDRKTSLSTAFAGVQQLQQLDLTCPPEYQSHAGIPKPCGTPEELASLPMVISTHLAAGDCSLPDTRDLRKFVRRLPRLGIITWTGRDGKGAWFFSKRSPTSSLVNVSFVHTAVSSLATWNACQHDAPDFAYDEQAVARLLEVPPPAPTPATKAEFPALTRTTSSSSAGTPVATPIQLSPVTSRHQTQSRLPISIPLPTNTGTLPSIGGLSIKVENGKSRNSRGHSRSTSVSNVQTHPAAPVSPISPILQTPKLHESSIERREERNKKGYSGILENVTRVVPGSGRPAALLREERDSRSRSRKGTDPVAIAEDDEDEYGIMHMDENCEEKNGGWTTVVKERPKETEVVVSGSQVKKSKKEKRSR